jgi:hypothetical protein
MGIQLYDVMPGRPFGRGTAQSTITSDPNTRTYGTGSGTSISLGSAILSNGDLACIHQTYGVAGLADQNWEPFIVASGGGSTSITTLATLQRTYSAGAQIIKVPEYLDLTVGAAIYGKSYGGSVANSSKNAFGGINIIAVRNKLTINYNMCQNGYQGYINSSDRGGMNEWEHFNWWYNNAPSGGHIGGANSTDSSSAAVGGNSINGYDGMERREANGNGGGAGWTNSLCGAGGGNGLGSDWCPDGGGGGASAAGNPELTSLHLGGGGGGPKGSGSGGGIWTGGSGGGAWIIWAREISFGASGSINADGGIGYGNNGVSSGSGAGGSILINCERGAFGTNLVTAAPGTYYPNATPGGIGRIRLNYGSLLTGTTNPSASVVQDPKLIAGLAPALFFFD